MFFERILSASLLFDGFQVKRLKDIVFEANTEYVHRAGRWQLQRKRPRGWLSPEIVSNSLFWAIFIGKNMKKKVKNDEK